MATEPDALAATAAREFVRALGAPWQARLGAELIGIYLIGSLAHGGFSARYSDVDVALVTQAGLAPDALEGLRADAAMRSAELARKLSVFWTDRGFSLGRFPPLD